jgi:hypothetical protein
MAYQTCRVCGVRVPAGFTNCDGCYEKKDQPKETKTKRLLKLLIASPAHKHFPDRRLNAGPDFDGIARAL